MTNRNRFHSVLWTGALGVSGVICFALMLQVTAVKSDIADTCLLYTSDAADE